MENTTNYRHHVEVKAAPDTIVKVSNAEDITAKQGVVFSVLFVLALAVSSFAFAPLLQDLRPIVNDFRLKWIHRTLRSKIGSALKDSQTVVVKYRADFYLSLEVDKWGLVATKPFLSSTGTLEHKYNHLTFDSLKLAEGSGPEIETLKSLAPILRDRYNLSQQLKETKGELEKARKLSTLVKTSDWYSAQASLLDRSSRQLTQAIVNSESLLAEQERWIRESLIAAEIVSCNLNLTLSSEMKERLEQLQQEYQETKNVIEAYWQLKQSEQLGV